MAKPIPEIDLRNISKKDEIKCKEDKTFYDETIDKISKYNNKELILGTFGGWIAGVGVAKVGKIAAFGLGGGIILLHFATEIGYINVNWERVSEGVGYCQDLIDKLLRFVKKNGCFSVGFIGGFFFGVASA
ncbi:FUN14 domain-containing protein 1-like [Vanessa cardui]|uniref:FUN14 domain-containing protein 1-like n=1 Tax=Vanessa cardui TaxID=171605 RepID=UPI001F132F48|nr:FUN14 domain-containing protein 1-like [Vanessa cardui]